MNSRSLIGMIGLPAASAAAALSVGLAIGPLEHRLARNAEHLPAIVTLRRSGARITVSGRDVAVTVDGALAPDVRDAAESAVRALPGARRGSVTAALATPMSPFRFVARRQGKRLVLSGGVPPGSVHAGLDDQGRALVGDDTVRDDLQPALGAPDNFAEAASLAVSIAGMLSSGEVVLSDGDFSVHGVTTEFARYNDIVASIARMPSGFGVTTFELAPPETTAFGWTASRRNGTVELSGFVPSEDARRKARAQMEEQIGGAAVTDRAQTARGLDSRIDFAELAARSASILARLERGEVRLDGRRLHVEGAGPALDLIGALKAELAGTRPGGVELASLDLDVVDLVPYRFSARRGREGLLLDGFVPDESTRAALLAFARQEMPGQAVLDRLHLARGAPDGFASASRTMVEAISDLASGRAELVGLNVTLDGQAHYPGLAARWRERFAASLPRGWSTVVAVTAAPIGRVLDVVQCNDLLGDQLDREPLRFDPGGSDMTVKTMAALEPLAAVLKRCEPRRLTVRAEVGGDDAAAAIALAEKRASLVAMRFRALLGNVFQTSTDGRAIAGNPTGAGNGSATDRDRVLVEIRP